MLSPDIRTSTIKEAYPYIKCTEGDEKVAALDPLSGDDFLTNKLPKINRSADKEALLENTIQFVLKSKQLTSLDILSARAALRDLGFLAGSLATHGIDPRSVPGLEVQLLRLGSRTDEVPRDTVFTYGPRNPKGARMRLFTDQPEERIFIDSFRLGMQELPHSIEALERASILSVHDEQFSYEIRQAEARFSNMVGSIVEVRRKITPQVFTHELRPYFPTFVVGGKEYVGPGGAQMPVILVDYLLWGSSVTDSPDYIHYFYDNLQYLPPELRQVVDRKNGAASILNKVEEELRASQTVSGEPIPGVSALVGLLNTIQKFRFPHKKVADDNMAIRQEGSLGSGGYTADILQRLIDLTSVSRRRIQQSA
jgi:hypothetical protein